MGVCVTQLEASSIERALVCAPGTVPTLHAAVLAVQRVRFFSGRSFVLLYKYSSPLSQGALRVAARFTSPLGTQPPWRT